MKKVLSLLFSLICLFSFGQTPEQAVRSGISTIQGRPINLAPNNSFTNLFKGLTDLSVKRVPYLTMAEVRAGKADTARVIQVLNNQRAYTYVYDASSSAADDSATVIRNGARRYVLSSDIISPEVFGVRGDGVTDDTQALQKALRYITARKATLTFQEKTYIISDELIIGVSTGWRIIGNGATLLQKTNNKAIFRLRVPGLPSVINNFRISGFIFQWATDQSYTLHPNSYAVAFEATADNGYGIYNFEIDNINVINGVYGLGISSTSIITTVWGAYIHDVKFGQRMTGSAIKLWYTPNAGMPNYRIVNAYIRSDLMQEPAIDMRQCSAVFMDNIEVNWVNANQTSVINLVAVTNLQIGIIRIEQGSFARNYAGMVNFSQVINGAIESIEVQNIFFNVANYAFVIRESSSNPSVFFTVKNITLRGNTLTAGVLNVIQAQASKAKVTGNVILDVASDYVYRYDNSWRNVDVAVQNQNTISADNGDASVTLTLNSERVQNFQTPLTVNRTITLPTGVLPNDVKFKINRAAAGPGTLAIGSILTMPANSTGWVEIEYRRGGSGTPAWIVTGRGGLNDPADASNLTTGVLPDARLSSNIATTAQLSGYATNSALTLGLAGKENAITAGTTGQYWRGDKSWQALNSAAVGLSAVNNTSDIDKPVSTATQSALNLKADDASVMHLSGTETVTGVKTFSANITLAALRQAGQVTLPTGNSLTFYNTADEATNFERGLLRWNSNVFSLETAAAGTGTTRSIKIGASGRDFNVNSAATTSTGFYDFNTSTGGASALLSVRNVSTASTGRVNNVSNTPTINQTGTAGYTAYHASVYEQAVGSGSRLLMDLGTNTAANNAGTHTSQFSVTSAGLATAVQYKVSALNTAPATATSTGVTGEIRVTSGFIYVCIATNTWVRAALSTW